jgi:four helix bundle protein
MELKDLDIYVLSRKISAQAWLVYKNMDWQTKKVIGDQWITATDSIGANIAEGFGRFHYQDRNRFNLFARGSLLESVHWTELIQERKLAPEKDTVDILELFGQLHPKLNGYIRTTKSLSDQ